MCKGGGTGGAGGAIAPPIFLEIDQILAFSTPNISRSNKGVTQKVISTPNILHLPQPMSTT